MDPKLAPISSTQQRVLETLKRSGEATTDELAQKLQISASAVRQHLNTLRSASYVVARQERGQPGRPVDLFHTTEVTETMFGATPNTFSIDLLAHVEEEDPELVTRIFDRHRRRRVEEARHKIAGKTVAEKVAVLAELFDAEGYLADSDEPTLEHYRINLHSCPIWPIATQYGQACTAELDFLRELIPEATIQRVTHKTTGAHACAYEITTGAS